MNLQHTYLFKGKNFLRDLVWKIKKLWHLIGFETIVWISGLAYLVLIHSPGETHFTICPLSNLGLKFCPGCGLGNSISLLFEGDFIASFHAHPLGIFALIIIVTRIVTIINNNRRRYA